MAVEDDYRHYAAECMALAQTASDPNDKARLVQMAQAWRELAEKRERREPEKNATDKKLK
jgi:hypothetical protein